MTGADAEHWMARCLTLAAKAQSQASPNPRVGAVIVDADGQCLGEGWHQAYGQPHAEVAAIRDARARFPADFLKQATLYVNLEPCSHHGQTPPCVDAIIDSGIPRVVIGMADPNPRAAGGAALLRSHGLEVTTGVLNNQCGRFNEAFTHHLRTSRPLVTLKIAQTLDSCVATRSGESQWITGEQARNKVHRWRAESDAVLIGAGTAQEDDPSLTVRHIEGPQPLRIVLDAQGRLRPQLKLFNDQWAGRTIVVVGEQSKPAYAEDILDRGVRIMPLPTNNHGHIDLAFMMQKLGTLADPIQSLLVEAGPGLATALLKANLVDRLFLFVAPKIIGQGTPSIGDLGIMNLTDAFAFAEHTWEVVGNDMLFCGYQHKTPD